MDDGPLIFTGDKIQGVRKLTMLKMLKLELKGMKRSRSPSAYMLIKNEFGLRGSRQRVYDQFETQLREERILV